MEKNEPVIPILKWAGGKRRLLAELAPLLPKNGIRTYCEPFLGGGAMLFMLQPAVAFANDVNPELINVYETVRDNVEELILDLAGHSNAADHYYAVRAWDRDRDAYAELSPVKRASRILYLNRTCYNGLFRVNGAGQFNTPFGRYKNPDIVNAAALRAVGRYLRSADIRLLNSDYAEVLEFLPADAFVYLDPPYFPVSETANFTGYAKGGFDGDEQIRLKRCCDALDRRGVKFMLSNSAAGFIASLYSGYDISVIRAKRSINSDSKGRGEVDEVVVRNYA